MVCVQKILPLELPSDKTWLRITKVIDRLHLDNHKNKLCHEIYFSEPLKEKYANLKTPVAEQVFIWSARFKKFYAPCPKKGILLITIEWW